MLEPKKDTEHKVSKDWHPQQAKLLKSWAEVASSYRWMHNQAYMSYKKKNLLFMIPLIVMSTVTGTANFAQSSFPEVIRPNVPQIIGAINLISAILTTIYQFLKISEFMESHRISSINYGKLARTLTVELNLPVKDRTTGGAECVKVSRTEIDRLIEQSPSIPNAVLNEYETKFTGKGLSEPEIIVINNVDVYEDLENKIAVDLAEAGMKFKTAVLEKRKTNFGNTVASLMKSNVSDSPTTRKKQEINTELNELTTSKLVSSGNVGTSVSSIMTKFMGSTPKEKPNPFKLVMPSLDEPVLVDENEPDNKV